MFCSKCGKANPDDAKFCEGCGNNLQEIPTPAPASAGDSPFFQAATDLGAAPAAPAAPAEPTTFAAPSAPAEPTTFEAPAEPATFAAPASSYDFDAAASAPSYDFGTAPAKKPFNTKLLIAGAVGLIVIILAVFGISKIFGSKPETPIKNLIKGYNNANTKLVLKSASPAQQKLVKLNSDYEDSLEDSVEYMEEKLDGDKITYKVKDKDKLDKDDLEDLEDLYNDRMELLYDMYDEDYGKDVKIKKAYEIEIEIEVDGEEDDVEFVVGKIGSKWCIINSGL